MVASEQWEDVTTCVLISAVITPKTTYFGTSLPPGTQYFLFRNMAFTFTDIQQIHAAYNDPETIITSAGKTWKVLTEEAANASIIVLPGILERMKGSEDFNGYTAVPDTSKDVVKSNGTVSFLQQAHLIITMCLFVISETNFKVSLWHMVDMALFVIAGIICY